jgi:hypothetical protein
MENRRKQAEEDRRIASERGGFRKKKNKSGNRNFKDPPTTPNEIQKQRDEKEKEKNSRKKRKDSYSSDDDLDRPVYSNNSNKASNRNKNRDREKSEEDETASECQIAVVSGDCLAVALLLQERTQCSTACLIMASSSQPGGGYRHGAGT